MTVQGRYSFINQSYLNKASARGLGAFNRASAMYQAQMNQALLGSGVNTNRYGNGSLFNRNDMRMQNRFYQQMMMQNETTTEEKSKKFNLSNACKGLAAGASAGAAIGSVFPGIGTVIGGAVGAVVGFVGGGFKNLISSWFS